MKKLACSLACAAALGLSVTAPVNAAGISNGEVKIGVLSDMSGVYSAIGGKGSVVAAEMAVHDFGGTVLGKPIKIVSADHQNKADVGSAVAREWIDKDHVDMITDILNSAVGIAVQKLASEKHTITMNTGAGSTALTNKDCTKYGIHYLYDTYALPVGTATAIVKGGGTSWYFITADYAFGHSLQNNTETIVKSLGGEIKGAVQAPLGTSDFSSYLIQAQGSGAKVIGLANAGADTINAIKQANEFGIVQKGQQLAGMLVFISDVKSLGLDTAKGLQFTTGYYWDRNDASRKFGNAFYAKFGKMPTMDQAGVYSAVLNYLKAVKAAGTDNADAVRAELGKMKIDFFGSVGHIRADGLNVHDMYLVKVKSPKEFNPNVGHGWDLLKVEATIPGDKAYMSLAQGSCKLVKK
ncbi:ABC transporter substrate-binding protein [Mangrovitalea sediminis]|uniref:ABC transporter substrate-binding protein n=1 Tax=Mangrovitalea sediminis TaxID=1982043 RepID=UPI000BE4D9FE|nr:ABC transporter substrate-binding protein [Mangrovitalea sediminis]